MVHLLHRYIAGRLIFVFAIWKVTQNTFDFYLDSGAGLEITIKIWVSVRKTCLSIWISLAISGFPVRTPKFKAVRLLDNSWVSGRKTCSKNWVSITIFGCPGHLETQ